MATEASINDLLGKVILRIQNTNDELKFLTFDGCEYRMWHEQDCCENVTLEEVVGDLNDLLFHPVLEAECVTNENGEYEGRFACTPAGADDSQTWTFYKLGTIRGCVTLRWFGTSNGCYSERVSFEQIKSAND